MVDASAVPPGMQFHAIDRGGGQTFVSYCAAVSCCFLHITEWWYCIVRGAAPATARATSGCVCFRWWRWSTSLFADKIFSPSPAPGT